MTSQSRKAVPVTALTPVDARFLNQAEPVAAKLIIEYLSPDGGQWR